MGVLKMEDGQHHFEIHYGGKECPFSGGGIDSSAPPPYIAPNSFVTLQNGIIVDNSIVAANLSEITGDYVFAYPNAYSIGMGDLFGVPFEVQFDPAAGGYGTLYVYSYGIMTLTAPTLIGTFALTVAPIATVGKLTYKNINGICYFSAPGLYNIYQHDNTVATVLTTYLGCSFLGELNGALLAFNVTQESFTTGPTEIDSNGSGGATATATSTTAGITTVNSSAVTFPSQAIPNSNIGLQLQANYGYTITISSGSALCTINVQYSLDGGTTWNTFQTFSASIDQTTNLDVNGTTPCTPAYFNVANIDTVQARVQVIIAAFVGGNYSIVGTVANVTMLLPYTETPVLTQYPFQVAWSAPLGAYEIFNPLDVNGLVTGAGFNNLPDVEDIITGFFTTGPTGYILREQGISEMAAQNSGTQPFNFNHLWSSHKGIGTLFPNTVAQYGSVGYFVSDTDIFTVGYDGINIIAGKAKSAIYALLNNPNYTAIATLGTIFVKSEPMLCYLIAFTNTVNNNLEYFIYKAEAKEWLYGIYSLSSIYAINLSVASLSLPSLGFPLTSSIVFNLQFKTTLSSTYETIIYGFINTPLIPIAANPMTLVFSAEELGFAKFPTIDSIGLYVYTPNAVPLIDLQLTAIINNSVTFNTIVFQDAATSGQLATGLNSGWNYYKLFPTYGKPYTGVTPQLSLTVSSSSPTAGQQFILGKVVLFGTIDPTQRPI